MRYSEIKEYVDNNRFSLFIYVVAFTLLSYFISYVGMTLMTALLFLVILVVDSKTYRKLKPRYIMIGQTISLDHIIGIILIALPFANYIANPFHTTPSFGNIDITFVLVGLTIFFYGIRRLWDFYLPIGFVIALSAFEFLMGTYFMQDILGPAFIQFTIFFSTKLLNFFGYHVSAGSNYFILPNGQRIYMLVWCSGIESFTLFTLLMIVLLLREKIYWPVKAMLIGIGAIGDLFINVIRVAILIVIAIDYGMPMMKVFHANLGDLLFLVYVLLYYWVIIKIFIKGVNGNV